MNSTLRVQAFLPLAWEKQGMAPHAIAALRHGSQLLMHASNLMDSGTLRDSENESAHLQRLDAKVDLMLHLLAHALQGSQPLPQSLNIEFGPEHISWQEPSTLPVVDETVVISLYLNPGLPLPVRLPARIVGHGDGQVTAQLIELGEELEESWQQWVFRQHRRHIHAHRPSTA